MKIREPIPIPDYMRREPTPEELEKFRAEQKEILERWYEENPNAKRNDPARVREPLA